jgi:hypothetical protein
MSGVNKNSLKLSRKNVGAEKNESSFFASGKSSCCPVTWWPTAGRLFGGQPSDGDLRSGLPDGLFPNQN